MINFCPKCGNQYSGGSFCSECRADLRGYLGEDVTETNAGDYLAVLDTLNVQIQTKVEQKKKEENPFEIWNGVLKWYKGKGGHVIVPNGVTSIDSSAFLFRKNEITSVILPEGVTTICMDTFSLCRSMESIILPQSVVKIENRAFSQCDKLSDIQLPSKLNLILDNAFWGCKNLKTIRIPEGVMGIGKKAFYGCSELHEIIIPSSVKIIDYEAFANCENLKKVIFYGTGVPPMRRDIFKDSHNIDRVYLPQGGIAQIQKYGEEFLPKKALCTEKVV